MAENNNANIGFEKQIWDAACVLWGHIPAADYRKVIVGLIFLRYISSAFDKRYQELVADGDGFEDDPDAYEEENVFFVPEKARWATIAAAAHTPEIGTVIDDAICFSNEGVNIFKILAGYHQYFAVKKAIASTQRAAADGGDGKGGVFWHTQGSGKSLSMVFYAHLLQEALDSPTIVVLTDRNDLDDQLYGQFTKCKEFLRQEPMHAESREHLKTLLAGRKANGIIFTTMTAVNHSPITLNSSAAPAIEKLKDSIHSFTRPYLHQKPDNQAF